MFVDQANANLAFNFQWPSLSLCKLVWFSIKDASSCLKIKNCNDCEIQSPTICDIADTTHTAIPVKFSLFCQVDVEASLFLINEYCCICFKI